MLRVWGFGLQNYQRILHQFCHNQTPLGAVQETKSLDFGFRAREYRPRKTKGCRCTNNNHVGPKFCKSYLHRATWIPRARCLGTNSVANIQALSGGLGLRMLLESCPLFAARIILQMQMSNQDQVHTVQAHAPITPTNEDQLSPNARRR